MFDESASSAAHFTITEKECLCFVCPKQAQSELRFEKTYETLSEAVIRSMEPSNACFPRGALTPPHVPTVPGSMDLTNPSPSTTPAVNRVFPPGSLRCLQTPIHHLCHPITNHTKGEAGQKVSPHSAQMNRIEMVLYLRGVTRFLWRQR